MQSTTTKQQGGLGGDLRSCDINVLFVNYSLLTGGIETMIRDFALRLKESHFCASVAIFTGAGTLATELAQRGVYVANLEKREGIDFRLVERLRRLIRERDIDIVHSNNYSAWLYSVLAVVGTGVKVVHTEHSRILGGWRRFLLERMLARQTSTVVAVSADVRRVMTEEVGIPAYRVRVIENGVDTERFQLSVSRREMGRRQYGANDGTVVFGIVARLVPVKAHDVLLQGFRIVHTQRPETKLVIAGDGPCRESLETLCDRLGLRHCITFLGEVRNPESVLSALDVYVLSSRDEGMNLTLLEAMCVGLPVVATAVGGNPEVVVDGVTGLLVPAENCDKLAEKMTTMADDAGMRRQLGMAGRERILNRFSQAATIRSYMDIYSSLAAVSSDGGT